ESLWKRYRLLRVISPIVFLLIWEGVVRLGEVNQLLVPAPASVLRTMVELTVDGRLPWAIAVSLHRVLQGFIYGSLLGIGLGLLVGWFRALEDGVDPGFHHRNRSHQGRPRISALGILPVAAD